MNQKYRGQNKNLICLKGIYSSFIFNLIALKLLHFLQYICFFEILDFDQKMQKSLDLGIVFSII
jgi:hypothetical protein